MFSTSRMIAGAALTGALLASTSSFAAPDPVAVADRFVNLLSDASGVTPSYDQAVYNPSEDTVTIVNMQMREGDDSVTVATINIKGYDEENTDGLGADSIMVTGVQMEIEGGTVFVASADVANLDIPEFTDIDNLKLDFTAANAGTITIMPPNDQPPVSIASITATNDNFGRNDYMSGHAVIRVEDVTVPPSAIPDEATQAFLSQSGYDSIVADIDMDVAYDAETQEMDINTIAVDLESMASISLSMKFGGIIAELLEDPEQMQGLVATATLRSANISLTNDTLFENALNFASQMSGQSVDQLKQQAPFVIGMGLAQIGDENFTAMVTEAVNAFLADPQSLTIDVAPANPLPVAQIAGAATTAPQTLPSLLEATVSANQ